MTGQDQGYLDSCIKSYADQRTAAFDLFVRETPAPDAQGSTDAEEKFSIRLPETGNYVILARAVRSVFNKTENYYWITPVEIREDSLELNLTNSNLLLHTETPIIY